MERVVDEAAKIQLDYLQRTLHDQQKRVEDVEQAIIDLAKRLEAIEQTLGSKT
jgi:septal ring factor EnvC (AmiA/AmiB activator)